MRIIKTGEHNNLTHIIPFINQIHNYSNIMALELIVVRYIFLKEYIHRRKISKISTVINEAVDVIFKAAMTKNSIVVYILVKHRKYKNILL